MVVTLGCLWNSLVLINTGSLVEVESTNEVVPFKDYISSQSLNKNVFMDRKLPRNVNEEYQKVCISLLARTTGTTFFGEQFFTDKQSENCLNFLFLFQKSCLLMCFINSFQINILTVLKMVPRAKGIEIVLQNPY